MSTIGDLQVPGSARQGHVRGHHSGPGRRGLGTFDRALTVAVLDTVINGISAQMHGFGPDRGVIVIKTDGYPGERHVFRPGSPVIRRNQGVFACSCLQIQPLRGVIEFTVGNILHVCKYGSGGRDGA